MKRVFYGREYELEEGVDWCSGCAFEKGRRKCHGGGIPLLCGTVDLTAMTALC